MKDFEKKSAQLSALNSQVSNQIIGPLHVNAEVIKRMLTIFEKNRFPAKLREMAQTVLIASNQAKSLANDLLDQEFIKKGRFVPDYSYGSIPDAINEIVKQVRMTLVRKDLKIESDLSFTRHVYPILQFDRRRL